MFDKAPTLADVLFVLLIVALGLIGLFCGGGSGYLRMLMD